LTHGRDCSPQPGSKDGPCLEACAHTDCAATRELAARTCIGCAEPIGYERRFFREDSGDPIHVACCSPPGKGPA
jgi:hypothetical protein